ncbi:hypothetical protein GS597_10595 [Synechococcales cyanobacterium C]|uniref:Tox-PL-2 domain-containing protein n=1 Tax=Petrachloros mirabilis ULC683 TaxID=2781853 RepID=A0A8K2A7I1_9CYAN|nr:papain fold toxin domain-containing protein [Petrachloros mirabilis]NCJ06949.1 hypothetical protein [Petrachloros mirabilis ULC683]
MDESESNTELRQQIRQIASSFGMFECVSCANAIQSYLVARGIRGKQVRLHTGSARGKYGNIYHDGLQRNISTNGRHVAIALEVGGQEMMFDNIHPEGILRQVWTSSFHCLAVELGSHFEVDEIEF